MNASANGHWPDYLIVGQPVQIPLLGPYPESKHRSVLNTLIQPLNSRICVARASGHWDDDATRESTHGSETTLMSKDFAACLVSFRLLNRVVTPLYTGQKSTMFVTMLFYIIGFPDFMLFWEGVKYTTK